MIRADLVADGNLVSRMIANRALFHAAIVEAHMVLSHLSPFGVPTFGPDMASAIRL